MMTIRKRGGALCVLALSGVFTSVAPAFGANLLVTSAAGTVGQYQADGTPVNASLVSGLGTSFGIAVSGSNLFVTDYTHGTIGEYTLDGAVVNASLVTGLTKPTGIAVSGSNLFATNYFIGTTASPGTIGEYTTAGTEVNAALVTLSKPVGIVVSGSNLLVASMTGTIGQYGIDGTVVNAALVTGLSQPTVVAVVPEPGAMLLLGPALAGMALVRRTRRA